MGARREEGVGERERERGRAHVAHGTLTRTLLHDIHAHIAAHMRGSALNMPQCLHSVSTCTT